MRVTVGMIVDMRETGHSPDEIIEAFPYLEAEDIAQAQHYHAPLANLAPPQYTP
jgi:uncharacterized protein (DUF433 family)